VFVRDQSEEHDEMAIITSLVFLEIVGREEQCCWMESVVET
jgi:hypothetical protein